MLKRWLQREKVNAIDRSDIEQILIEMDVLDPIKAGNVRCGKCGGVISLDSIQCLYSEGNEIKFCCSKIGCYKFILKNKI